MTTAAASRDRVQAAAACTSRRRVEAERLIRLAQHLEPPDRDLVKAVYERGITATALARATGAQPRAIRSRLRRLVQRITSPAYQYVLRCRDNWPSERRQIAEAVFIRGQCQRSAASQCNVTLHRVRRESDRIRVLADQPPQSAKRA